MSSPIKHSVKVCETDASIIEVYAGGKWPHLNLSHAQAIELWAHLGEAIACSVPRDVATEAGQPRLAVGVGEELEALVTRWQNTDEHFGDDHGKAMTECADELRAIIDRAGGGS